MASHSHILRERFAGWLSRRHGVQKHSAELNRRTIYILPTGAGYTFFVVLFVMLLWAINYTNSLAFVLTFLLATIALNAMWRTHAGLLALRITPAAPQPVFAGQQARFDYTLEQPGNTTRYGIGLRWGDQAPVYSDVPAAAAAGIGLTIPAPRRGRLLPGRIQVLTRFPLGLFQAWSWVTFDQFCLVYPQPLGPRPLPLPGTATATLEGASAAGAGSDDYAGLGHYMRGDSPRHVAWKASVRNEDLLVKRFSARQRPELWLDWWLLDPEPKEARLSQLCQWLLKADAQGYDYGLRLPGLEFPPAGGEAHRRRCLQALALFD
jgi:uncharacterized protein (DUF58 family)